MWSLASNAGTSHGIISTNKEAEMVKLINKVTGGEMWVAEERLDEYLAAGHRMPVDPVIKPAKPPAKPKAAPKKGKAKK